MVATVNPCGFAMLPAYLSFFLGVEQDTCQRQSRARGRHAGDVWLRGTFAVVGLVANT